ncbi:hypothetical protein SAMN05414137_10164 [Streptacidiphilus jiangxiensis]|uniref:Uncharacterized protein n=1 Tax=Streptacidiphilus jiangxiensis TaxID=235985 RepID=A0A1H7F2Y8_STRJI|nr:hypothetical protein SAMN05414137_10164 [Streptacidiphilus jiangxiensis]
MVHPLLEQPGRVAAVPLRARTVPVRDVHTLPECRANPGRDAHLCGPVSVEGVNADSISRTSTSTAPGDGLVRAGAILFAVGAVATIATVLPLFLGLHRLPTPAYFVCMVMPLGFAVALGGLFRSARAQRRQVTSD